MKRTWTSPRKASPTKKAKLGEVKEAKKEKRKVDQEEEDDPSSPESSGDEFVAKEEEEQDEEISRDPMAVEDDDEPEPMIDEDDEEDDDAEVDRRQKRRSPSPKKKSSSSKGTKSDTIDIEDLDPPSKPSGVKIHKHEESRHRFSDKETAELQSALLSWFDQVQRVMPWRKPSPAFVASQGSKGEEIQASWDSKVFDQAYGVIVSEIMLQQTQVATVINYFNKWMKEFPTFEALAAAPLERVNELWAGLGYYRRAKFLHLLAQEVVNKHKGQLPRTAEQLLKLPGIGQYTAGAVASIAFGEVTPLVDGNVVRVFARLRAIAADSKSPAVTKFLWKIAGSVVDGKRPGDFNQALMELGATVCTPKDPQCNKCPVRSLCLAHKEVVELKKAKEVDESTVKSPCGLCTSDEATLSVTKYPIVSKKKPPRDLSTLVTIIERPIAEKEKEDKKEEYEYLFVQRPSTGLLASFWEFPSSDLGEGEDVGKYEESKVAMDEFISNKLGVVLKKESISDRRYLGEVTHVFSHIKQTLHVELLTADTVDVTLNDKLQWATPERMKTLAMSKGMKKCFDLIARAHQGGKKKGAAPAKKKEDAALSKTSKIDSFFKVKK